MRLRKAEWEGLRLWQASFEGNLQRAARLQRKPTRTAPTSTVVLRIAVTLKLMEVMK